MNIVNKAHIVPTQPRNQLTEHIPLMSAVSSSPPLKSKLHLQNTLLVTFNAFLLSALVVSRWSAFQVKGWPPSQTLIATLTILLITVCISVFVGGVAILDNTHTLSGAAKLGALTLIGALTSQVVITHLLSRAPPTAANIAFTQLHRACLDEFERSACVTQLHRSPQLASQLSTTERSEIRTRLVDYRATYPKSFWRKVGELQKTSKITEF